MELPKALEKAKKPYDLKKYFTEDGLKALRVKLETSLRFYNEEEKGPVKYPLDFTMLGFPRYEVESRPELYGRIIELAHLLDLGLSEEITKEKTSEGEKIIKKMRIKLKKEGEDGRRRDVSKV